MLMEQVFDRFVRKSPISVMARAAMERALSPEALDAMFGAHAVEQYERDLLFSSVVDLMGVVVCKIEPCVCAAFKEVADSLPVSLTSVYNKLNGLEPGVTSALVRHTAEQLSPVIVSMEGQISALLPGYRVRILDGNHLAATERRLKVLRGSIAGPLPGHSLVVLDPSLMLATNMIPCEDGHAQERSLTKEILALVAANDVWIADRNFCTTALLTGIRDALAFFVIRQHANLTIVSAGTLRHCGRTDTGDVYEQPVTIKDAHDKGMKLRRIIVKLDKPTRDGDAQIAILTNVSKKVAGAVAVANLYRERWTLETMFQSLTQMLEGEIAPLGYPRAALFGFGVALATYNILSTVQAALRATFGTKKVEDEVSGYYIANQVRKTTFGMSIATDAETWRPYQTMEAPALATQMLAWATHVDLRKIKKHPRKTKTPVPKRTRYAKKSHVSTAKLLAESKGKSP